MAAAYRPSSGASGKVQTGVQQKQKVGQGCSREGSSPQGGMVWLQDGREVGSDPRSRPELPHNIKDSARGAGRGHRGAGAGGRANS